MGSEGSPIATRALQKAAFLLLRISQAPDMRVRGTPFPNEGRISGRISIDGYFETGNAAG